MSAAANANDEGARANAYALLARCQTAAPTAEWLAQLAALGGANAGQDETAQALAALAAAAGGAPAAQTDEDYHQLFIGLGRGKLLPYASKYITGNMMDLPLARLRADLAKLGVAKQSQSGEPEDHAGALCELMAMLCGDSAPTAFARQKQIFEAHLAPWMEAYFDDMAREAGGAFYRACGDFGAAFMRFEKRYFAMLF